jgi:hypothetical protein
MGRTPDRRKTMNKGLVARAISFGLKPGFPHFAPFITSETQVLLQVF